MHSARRKTRYNVLLDVGLRSLGSMKQCLIHSLPASLFEPEYLVVTLLSVDKTI